MNSKYTAEQWKLLETDIESGMTFVDVAEKYGIPYKSIKSHYMRKDSASRAMGKKHTDKQWAALEADVENGMTYTAAGEKYGIPYGTVSSHYTYKREKEKKDGENMGVNKYTDPQWAAIEVDIKKGMSYRSAAEKHGIPFTTLYSHFKKATETSTEASESTNYERKCPICGTVIESPKMKFCWNCGHDIRAEELLLLEDIDELLKIISIVPSSQVEKGIQLILKLENYIKAKAEEKGCL